MKTVIDIYNEMWMTYHWASPYNYAENRDVDFINQDAINNFAETGDY